SGGQLHVRAQVVDDKGRAQTFRRLSAFIAGPDGISFAMPLEPVGAGVYAATQPLSRPGTYVVTAKDELDNKIVSTTGAVLTAGEEMRPTGTDRLLLARISSMTGGKTRDTLAGVFADRSAFRFSYWPLTPWLSGLGAVFLLLSVGARRLSVPTAWLQRRRKPSTQKAEKAQKTVQEVTATLDRLGKAKERAWAGESKGAGQGHAVARPAPVAWQPPPMGSSVIAQQRPTVSATVQPAEPGARMSSPPSARPLTAAEILLQKRKGRRG
ncbi:MAG TPA: hypothetical protein PL065_16880, partial [Polyangiaceae bacterium]|nr:hypothetical protein [Polyangiaceae bacterium]